MSWLSNRSSRSASRHTRRSKLGGFQRLEAREVFAADPLPVLMVIADQQDFYYKEYGDTRASLEAAGLDVVVAATTTNIAYPHPGSGQGASSGAVTPDLALSAVNAADYSAIVFVGGWGSSMYQYAFNDPNLDGVIDNYYASDAYNGDDNLWDGQMPAAKVVVNDLIGDFLTADKPVAAICHATTVLAWARVDGTSPIAGRHVAVPTTVMAPDQFYDGQWHTGGYYLGQYEQIIANGGLASPVSGSIGQPGAWDDVVVDGRIITGENFDSALVFGQVIAKEVLALVPPDPEPGVVQVGNDLVVTETDAADTIYVWSDKSANVVFAWMNGVQSGPFVLPVGGRVIVHGGGGNDQIFATDLRIDAAIYGEAGHDLITGGTANDTIDGGDGVDRIWGGLGNDLLRGGAGNDYLYGREGSNILLGGDGDDYLEGADGRDLLIGGLGTDTLRGASGEDILIGGTTSHDASDAVLTSILATWNTVSSIDQRIALLSQPAASYRLIEGDTVQDDGFADVLVGGAAADWFFANAGEWIYASDASDRVI